MKLSLKNIPFQNDKVVDSILKELYSEGTANFLSHAYADEILKKLLKLKKYFSPNTWPQSLSDVFQCGNLKIFIRMLISIDKGCIILSDEFKYQFTMAFLNLLKKKLLQIQKEDKPFEELTLTKCISFYETLYVWALEKKQINENFMRWYLLTLNNNERVAYKKIFSESFPNEIIPQRWLKGILECSEIFDKLYLLIQNADAIYKINSIKAFLRENSEELKKNPELFEQYLKLIQII
jgi:hypothetical protein